MMKDRTRMAVWVRTYRVREINPVCICKYAKQLIEQGDAYYCFCDKERLESLKSTVSEMAVQRL